MLFNWINVKLFQKYKPSSTSDSCSFDDSSELLRFAAFLPITIDNLSFIMTQMSTLFLLSVLGFYPYYNQMHDENFHIRKPCVYRRKIHVFFLSLSK